MSKNDLNVLKLKKKSDLDFKNTLSYFNFKSVLEKYINSKSFVVAVSGGPDSLALAALSKIYQKEKKCKVYYLLVDHRIRNNSAKESILVKNLLRKNRIVLTILTNKKKIYNNIQSNAREIRYELISNFCKKKGIKFILTGHHSDDQIETFLIRLSRGSGVQGLSSMSKSSTLKNNIRIIRPLLDEKKIELIKYAKISFGKFFKDPSNTNKKYLRSKIRKLISHFNKSGISHDRIIQSINNLASTRDTLNSYIKKVSHNCVSKKNKKIFIDLKRLLVETEEIQLRVLTNQIKVLSKNYYPPRSAKVLNLIKKIKSKKKLKSTLGKCIVVRKKNQLIIYKETIKEVKRP